ncbi:hypothetical protein PoB_000327700 [Plakobranchus ocellatus]|uniref:Uncharacterized protein n=1 Tax=Plakobranchus ocellatus TaxID=259542 RepID=A0AAV3Y231_9GAST|nr:hypothetical protein PoB_000327700 [Plakobranchus ocellatus]
MAEEGTRLGENRRHLQRTTSYSGWRKPPKQQSKQLNLRHLVISPAGTSPVILGSSDGIKSMVASQCGANQTRLAARLYTLSSSHIRGTLAGETRYVRRRVASLRTSPGQGKVLNYENKEETLSDNDAHSHTKGRVHGTISEKHVKSEPDDILHFDMIDSYANLTANVS